MGILAANLYIQSKPTQEKIELKLSETLRMPLEIERASLTPWGGLSITGITVPQAGGNFLDARECSIHFRFFPLFGRKLVIDQILLDEPKVVWAQNASGRWEFPEFAPQPEPEPAESPSPAPSPEPAQPPVAPEMTPAPGTPKPPEARPAAGQVKPFEVVMSLLKIRNGSFDFSDAAGHRIALFSDVNVEIPAATPGFAAGTAVCDKISFRDRLFAGDLKTRFSYSKERLAVSDLQVRIADGVARGDLVVKTAEPKSPFTADVRLDKVNLNRLISEAGGQQGQAGGTLSGYLDIYGLAGETASIGGSGQLELAGGRFQQYEILQFLGKLLQIEELSQLNLERAFATWRIEDGVIRVDQLLLQSANLRITAHGTVNLDGRLDLDANLAINKKISRQLPAMIEENFIPVENSDLRAVDFKIFGTLSHPRTDLQVRLLGRDVEKKVEKKAIDLLQNIFGGKKPRRDNRNQNATPAPANP